jgi:NADH:ubiquinone oxidoreductase subunit H
MFKIINLIISLAIPVLLYFDMVDPFILIMIGVYCGFSMVVNLLGAVILTATQLADDLEFKNVMKERTINTMTEDKNYFYRSTAVLITNCFILYMIIPYSITVSVIIGITMLLMLINMILISRIMDEPED